MIKKTFFLTAAFFILAMFNLFLVEKTYTYSKKRQMAESLLAEVSEEKDLLNSYKDGSSQVKGVYTEANLTDGRVANLKSFFRKYNSPLYDEAERIVVVSDKYQFDYRLLPAIAMQESNLCRVIPFDSYNCWGWGIYGDTVTKFDSYGDAIETIGKGIKKYYIDQGLTTASQIMSKYTPSSNGSWAHGVNTFLKVLE